MKKAKPAASKPQAARGSKPSSASSKPQPRPAIVYARQPEARPLVRRALEDYRRRYERGDGEALLLAIDLYLETFKVPKWMADGFFEAMTKWINHQAATLDEAFNVRRSVGKHLDRRRERERLRPWIMLEIARLQQRYRANIDGSSFAQVGDYIGKSGSYVRDVYYEDASLPWRNLLRHFRVERKS
jgi:hypothetical protein